MKTVLVTLLLAISLTNYAQDKTYWNYTNITVAKFKNGSCSIELSGSQLSDVKYWVGTTTNTNIQNALIKANKWAVLNEEKKMEFEKEIIRFRFMEKKDYEFHGYVQEFTREGKVSFRGLNDGTFECSLSFEQQDGSYSECNFTEITVLSNVIKMLQGKPVSKSDEIFN